MRIKIISTTATKYLFDKINGDLRKYKLEHTVEKFSDGEMSVKFPESVRDHHLFVLAANSKPEDIVELILTLDAAHLASAKKVTLLLPFFGYSRQDRQEGYRGSYGAKVFARLFTGENIARLVDRVVSIDLHAEQIQGFFDTPCEHVRGHSFLIDAVRKHIDENTWFCAPDAGAGKRVEKWQGLVLKKFGIVVPMVTINKFRDKPGSVSRMELTSDVSGKRIIIFDDIVDTFGTIAKAVQYLKDKGAIEVIVVFTHPVLSGKAIPNINNSQIDKLIFSDTIHHYWMDSEVSVIDKPFEIVSCVPVIENVITRIILGGSVSEINY